MFFEFATISTTDFIEFKHVFLNVILVIEVTKFEECSKSVKAHTMPNWVPKMFFGEMK